MSEYFREMEYLNVVDEAATLPETVALPNHDKLARCPTCDSDAPDLVVGLRFRIDADCPDPYHLNATPQSEDPA